ncbi:hypothetical protein A2125_02265 [Candidatus Woesebacteria bacterium GWB1_43_5]|uniref:Uncharacterized protein n=1 Tax=Candidatus Woesebacteria bacterium GWB1_43_5 TaxID=1802474 RepID=A0A1F7WS42_9BACT|nr:MAG: hypothetical protein A2125_02265 [Candidatus Woesebacteria bacterium GWB1_43_5]
MKNIPNKEMQEIVGTHLITICDATKKGARIIDRLIKRNIDNRKAFIEQLEFLSMKEYKSRKKEIEFKLKGYWKRYKLLISVLHKFYTKRQQVVHNITTTVGRNVLARRLSGNTTYTGIVNYCAVGDNNTAAVIGDATLGNETSRKVLSSGTYSSNIAYLETFFDATEAVDTHEEYGFYIDGGAGANTGQLFNRFTATTVKSNVETMNIQSIVTFNDA